MTLVTPSPPKTFLLPKRREESEPVSGPRHAVSPDALTNAWLRLGERQRNEWIEWSTSRLERGAFTSGKSFHHIDPATGGFLNHSLRFLCGCCLGEETWLSSVIHYRRATEGVGNGL